MEDLDNTLERDFCPVVEVKQDLTEKLSEKAVASGSEETEETEEEEEVDPAKIRRDNIILGISMGLMLLAALIYIYLN